MHEDDKKATAKVNTCAMGQACRQSARNVLEDQAYRERKRTHALETLIKVIPWSFLSQEDEEVLWSYFCEL